jgi:hypothetical protein
MKIVLIGIIAGLFSPAKADPLYLDPGSGSFLIQLIIASAVGAAFVIRSYWGKIKSFANRLLKKQDTDEIPEDE